MLGSRVAQCAPLIGCVTQPETFGRGLVDAAVAQVVARIGARIGIEQHAPEEIARERVRLVVPAEGILLGPAGTTHLVELDSRARRHVADRLDEVESEALHHEREDITRFATTEALVEPLRRHDVEARRALLVEWAVGLEFLSRLLQRDHLPDQVDQVGTRPHLVHLRVRNHPTLATVTPDPPSPCIPIRNSLTRWSCRSNSCTRARTAPVPLP